jgi:integrase
MNSHIKRLVPTFGDSDPQAISVSDVQEWIGQNADLNPSSFRPYIGSLRLLLDFAGIDPNPARDKRIKLPRVELAEIEPPTSEQVETIIGNVKPRWQLPLRTLEQSRMRVGELTALEWRDVDVAGSRFRIRGGKTAAARRWLAVPAWLMVEVQATLPARRSHPRAAGFPGPHGRLARERDGASLQGGRDSPLPPARLEASLRLAEAARGRPGHRPRGATRAQQEVDDPRYLLARDDRRIENSM